MKNSKHFPVILPKHQPCGHLLVLFYRARCLDGQRFSGQTVEIKGFDLDASKTYLSPGEREFQERTPWREGESSLTPATQRWSLGFRAQVVKWPASLKAWADEPVGIPEGPQPWLFSTPALQRAQKQSGQVLLEPRTRNEKLVWWRGSTNGKERAAPGHLAPWQAEYLPGRKGQLTSQSRQDHFWGLIFLNLLLFHMLYSVEGMEEVLRIAYFKNPPITNPSMKICLLESGRRFSDWVTLCLVHSMWIRVP